MVKKLIKRIVSRFKYKGRKPSNKSKDSKIKKLIKLAKQNNGKKKKRNKH